MVMLDIFAHSPPQRALTQENYLGQTLLLHRSDPALRMGIQVRATRRKHQRFDIAGRDDRPEGMGVLGVAVVQEIATI